MVIITKNSSKYCNYNSLLSGNFVAENEFIEAINWVSSITGRWRGRNTLTKSLETTTIWAHYCCSCWCINRGLNCNSVISANNPASCLQNPFDPQQMYAHSSLLGEPLISLYLKMLEEEPMAGLEGVSVLELRGIEALWRCLIVSEISRFANFWGSQIQVRCQ